MQFFIPMTPPTATAQEKQVTLRGGRRGFYKNARLQKAEDDLTWALTPHAPQKPLSGPLRLRVMWLYKSSKTHPNGLWRATRPDTDNLNKMLKDIMTRLGYWKDDAQVCDEQIQKLWADRPGLFIEIEELPAHSGLWGGNRPDE